MDTFTVVSYAVAFLAIAATIGIPIWLKARRIQNAHFETIGAQWLKRLNTVADALPDKISGNLFCRTSDKSLKVRRDSSSWWVGYPIHKEYPETGSQEDVIMVICIYSLVPSNDGAVTTVLVGLTEPVRRWWEPFSRHTVFPSIINHLHAYGGKEMKLTLPPAPESKLVPKKVSS